MAIAVSAIRTTNSIPVSRRNASIGDYIDLSILVPPPEDLSCAIGKSSTGAERRVSITKMLTPAGASQASMFFVYGGWFSVSPLLEESKDKQVAPLWGSLFFLYKISSGE